MPFPENFPKPTNYSKPARLFRGALVIAAALLILAGAASLPFYFKSSSIYYKFGMDRILLRSGKIIGLLTACLILFQGTLTARFKGLDRVFGLNRLVNCHRVNGNLIAGGAVLHPILILGSEGVWTIPFTLRYWPELVGASLAICVIGVVLAADFRSVLKLPFHLWRPAHQWGVFGVSLAMFVHVAFVSETFASGLPKMLLLSAFGVYLAVFSWVRLKAMGLGKAHFQVLSVAPAGAGAYQIKLAPLSGKPLHHVPGQFAFFRFHSLKVKKEEHPFTIASPPHPSGQMELIVRGSGDWTRKVQDLVPGDMCLVDGPYGLFTSLNYNPMEDVLMIAGGIGITPMLCMLRAMGQHPGPVAQRKILLLWSNQTRDHIVLPDEFKHLESTVAGLDIRHILTREPPQGDLPQRLDPEGLSRLLSGFGRSASVFVCGPPNMTDSLSAALRQMGFARSTLHSERFVL